MSIRIITAIAGLMLAAAPAQAVITSITLSGGTAFTNGGTGQIVAQPATFGPTGNDLFGFNELQNLVLAPSGLTARASLFGANGVNNTFVSDVRSAVPVSSHFFYFTPAASSTATGQITFNQNVIAVQRARSLFDAARSAQLHNGGSDFTTLTIHGVEAGDIFTLVDAKTISFNLSASNTERDAFRVLTAIPEPSTWMMMLTGFGLIGFARRRRNVAVAA